MKITSQTADELVLKDGRGFNFLFSFAFMILAAVFGFAMYSSGTRGSVSLLPAGAVVFGPLWFLLVPSIAVDIKKGENQIFYQKKRPIGTRNATYAISDVARIEARKQWKIEQVQNMQQNRTIPIGSPSRYGRLEMIIQAVLVFKDGKELPLETATGSYSQSTGSSEATAEKEASIAQKVAEFLGVPFQEIEPPQMNTIATFGPSGTIQS